MLKDTKEVIKSSKSENSHKKKQQQKKRGKRTKNDHINTMQETKIEQGTMES